MSNVTLSLTITSQLQETAPFLYGGSFCSGIEFAHSLGYNAVEIHTASPENLSKNQLQHTLQKTNLKISALGTGRAYVEDGLSLTSSNPCIRNQALQRIQDFIQFASDFQCLVILGCIRGNLANSSQLPEALKLLSEAMHILDKFALSHGVTLVLEPINRYENNFLCTIDSVASFLHENHFTNVKMMIDTFHMNIEESDLYEPIHKYHDDIYYIHFADSNRLYPGQGHLDFQKMVALLKKYNYNKGIGAECLFFPDYEISSKNWLAAVKELFN